MRRLALVGTIIFVNAWSALPSGATTSALFVSGDAADGVSGGVFSSLHSGAINELGKIAFRAELEVGVGGVTAANDNGVWLVDSGMTSLVARTGMGGVPDVAGADFDELRDFGIDAAGDVYLRGSLDVGVGGVTNGDQEGIWSYSSGSDQMIVRTGTSPSPGVPTTTFSALPNTLPLADNGQISLMGTLNHTGSVSNQNDRGIWTFDKFGGTLLARKDFSAPGISAAYASFSSELVVNSNLQTAFRAALDLPDSSTRIGIWRYSDSSGDLIAREGVGNVPNISVTSFTGLGEPALNGFGQLAFSASLTHEASVNSTNDAGLWLYNGSSGTLLAQRGSGGVPTIAGANFESFGQPIISASGHVLSEAELQIGVGGVSASNNLGLWTFDGVSAELIARTGSGAVPGVSGASYSDFTTTALNALGSLAVKATLQPGGSISASNDEGLWIFDSQGNGELVAREGDLLAGRIIESLDFLGGSGGNDGASSGFGDQGQLLFQVEFTNGDNGLFLHQTIEADFDGDGDVDGADLKDPVWGWEARFGVDLNARDFLIWQKEIGDAGPSTSPLTSLPEPGTLVLCCILSLSVASRRRSI